ncbi:MAG: hypothetical protein HW404_1960, partial [Anaerolineales bacterium]|nr:hypothetical protein [Anaerolineales bacterium]
QCLPNVSPDRTLLSPTVPFATFRLPPFVYPDFKRYYETAKTAASVAPFASDSLARGVLRRFPCFARTGRRKRGLCARTLVNRCRPYPVVVQRIGAALPAFQDAPRCLCHALRSRPGLHARGLRPSEEATYYVQGGVAPPGVSRKTQTMYPISGLNHAALALAPYASRTPCGYAGQCSLPSGCQPFSGGSAYPLGIDYMFPPFHWFPHVLVAGARPRWIAFFPLRLSGRRRGAARAGPHGGSGAPERPEGSARSTRCRSGSRARRSCRRW